MKLPEDKIRLSVIRITTAAISIGTGLTPQCSPLGRDKFSGHRPSSHHYAPLDLYESLFSQFIFGWISWAMQIRF